MITSPARLRRRPPSNGYAKKRPAPRTKSADCDSAHCAKFPRCDSDLGQYDSFAGRGEKAYLPSANF
jgi:hypothetical protein